jgi:predicted deacylase
MTSTARRPSSALLGALAVLLGALVAGMVVNPAGAAASPARPAVVSARVVGHSVAGRPLHAYRLGDPGSANRVVVMSTMHGDEPATRRILAALRDGAPISGIDLWVVPVVNPDGLARHTRKNAHGVDLNRNYPYRWADLDGRYESGPRAASEPETRALMAFFAEIRPRRVVSIHQPLNGVDVSTPASRPFAVRLADGLDLPRRNLTCGGTCYGTFTQWFMHRFGGVAVTVEYGAHPSLERMTTTAPRQLLRVLGATR